MPNKNMDKAFLDSSWKEMKIILDNEMPANDNRKIFLIWFVGLLLLATILGTAIYNYTRLNKIDEAPEVVINNSQNSQNSSLKNNVNNEEKISEIIHLNTTSTTTNNNTADQLSLHNEKTDLDFLSVSMKNLDQKKSNDHIKTEEVGYIKYLNENDISNPTKTSFKPTDSPAIINKEINSKRAEIDLFAIPTLKTKPISLDPSYRIIGVPEKTYPIYAMDKTSGRAEVWLSTRLHDQVNTNGELSLYYNLGNENIAILPGVGFGYDNYNLTRVDGPTGDRTFINENVNFSGLTTEVQPSSSNEPTTITIEDKRSFYWTPGLMIRKRIKNDFSLLTGIVSRIYFSNGIDESTLNDSNELGASAPQEDGSAQSRQNTIELEQDRFNNYFMVGMNTKLASYLDFNLSYLYQMDKSLAINPYTDNSTVYTSILEKINRNEIRIGLSLKF